MMTGESNEVSAILKAHHKPAVKCKTCDVGVMSRKSVHRLSWPVVAIGYVFVVPSLLGMLFGCLLLVVGRVEASSASEATRERLTLDLRNAGLTEPVISDVVNGNEVDTDALPTYDQQFAVLEAQESLVATNAGGGVGALMSFGVAIVMFIGSFVGGLLGYLLIMKKRILQCSNCEAVVQAS
jgi:hypothetical protein